MFLSFFVLEKHITKRLFCLAGHIYLSISVMKRIENSGFSFFLLVLGHVTLESEMIVDFVSTN